MEVECPYCKSEAYADFVGVGVGGEDVQVTPYECSSCNARQMSGIEHSTDATEEERKTGWWRGEGDAETWSCSACGWKEGVPDDRLMEPDRSTYPVCLRCGNSTSCKGKRMSTKVEFDVIVSLNTDDVLALLRGEKKTVQAGPPGAAMVQANARVQFTGTDEEKRQIIDAFTRGPNSSYDSGFSITRWGDKAPVPGSTEWLMLIASNADRIWIKVSRSGALVDVQLLAASEEEQRMAVHAWLSGRGTPEFRVAAPPAEADHQRRMHLVHALTNATYEDVHSFLTKVNHPPPAMIASFEAKLMAIRHVLEAKTETDIRDAYAAGTALGWFGSPTHGAIAPSGPALKELEAKFRGVAAAKTEQSAYEKIEFIFWVEEHSRKSTGTGIEQIRNEGWHFLRDMRTRLQGDPHTKVTERQMQWLNDCHAKAMSRAKPIGHLLPPTPSFADPRITLPRAVRVRPEPTPAVVTTVEVTDPEDEEMIYVPAPAPSFVEPLAETKSEASLIEALRELRKP